MADWQIAGTYIEFCNCDPGCGCNFRGLPTSPEGNCQAVISHVIESGSCDGTDLVGAKASWALWWPGPIHEGGGKGHAYIDCGSDEQYEALSRIWRGEEGYGLFEIFNSMLDEKTAVERAAIDLTVNGTRSTVSIDGVTDNRMTPLTNPVSGDENEVRIVKKTGFIWRDGEIAQSEKFSVDLPEMNWDLKERHTVFSTFDYANASLS
ncbi:MAG: DUF1326 domain-containing protein [Actinomycetota bacterium]